MQMCGKAGGLGRPGGALRAFPPSSSRRRPGRAVAGSTLAAMVLEPTALRTLAAVIHNGSFLRRCT